jgi:hypothetical protein
MIGKKTNGRKVKIPRTTFCVLLISIRFKIGEVYDVETIKKKLPKPGQFH